VATFRPLAVPRRGIISAKIRLARQQPAIRVTVVA
jgi:hypothetical protein